MVGCGPAYFAHFVGGRIKTYSRSLSVNTQIAVTSAYGVDAIDGVYFDLSNLEGFRTEAQEPRGLIRRKTTYACFADTHC